MVSSFLGNMLKSTGDLAYSSLKSNYGSIGNVLNTVERLKKKIHKDTALEDITKITKEYSSNSFDSYRKFSNSIQNELRKKSNPNLASSLEFIPDAKNLKTDFNVNLEDLDLDKDFSSEKDIPVKEEKYFKKNQDGSVLDKNKRTKINNKFSNTVNSHLLDTVINALQYSSDQNLKALGDSFSKVSSAQQTEIINDGNYFSDVSSNLDVLSKNLDRFATNIETNNGAKTGSSNLSEQSSLAKMFATIKNEYGREYLKTGRSMSQAGLGEAFGRVPGFKALSRVDKFIGQFVPRAISGGLSGGAFDAVKHYGRKLGKYGDATTTNGRTIKFLEKRFEQLMKRMDPRSGIDVDIRSAKILDPSSQVAFDSETHTSINKVIPGYFSKIVASMGGTEEEFRDYTTGKWQTSSDTRKNYNEQMKKSVTTEIKNSTMGESLSKMMNKTNGTQHDESSATDLFYRGYKQQNLSDTEKKQYENLLKSKSLSDKNTIEALKRQIRDGERHYNQNDFNLYTANPTTSGAKNAIDEHFKSPVIKDTNGDSKATKNPIVTSFSIADLIANKMENLQPKLLEYVKEILSDIKDKNGTPIKKLVDGIKPDEKRNVKNSSNNLPMDIRKKENSVKKIENEKTEERERDFKIPEFLKRNKKFNSILQKAKNSKIGQGISRLTKNKSLSSILDLLGKSKRFIAPLVAAGGAGLGAATMRPGKASASSLFSGNSNTSGSNYWDKINSHKAAQTSRNDNGPAKLDPLQQISDEAKRKLQHAGVDAATLSDPEKLSKLGLSISPLSNLDQLTGKNGEKIKKQMKDMERAIDSSGLAKGKSDTDGTFSSNPSAGKTQAKPTSGNSDKDKVYASLKSAGFSDAGASSVMGVVQASGKNWSDLAKDSDKMADDLKKSPMGGTLTNLQGDVEKATKANKSGIEKAIGISSGGSVATAVKDAKETQTQFSSGGQGDGSQSKEKEGSQSTSSDGKIEKMIKYATSKVGSGYSQTIRTGPQYDCSGLVWAAMKDAGFSVPGSPWATPAMHLDATGPHTYLKKIDAKDAKRGDIVITGGAAGAGNNGHTAILLDDYKADGSHKLVQALQPIVTDKWAEKDWLGINTSVKIYAHIVGSGTSSGGSSAESKNNSDDSSKSSDDPFKDQWLNESVEDKKADIARLEERLNKRYDKAKDGLAKAIKKQIDDVDKLKDQVNNGNMSYGGNGNSSSNNSSSGGNGSNSSSSDDPNDNSSVSDNNTAAMTDIISGNNHDKYDPNRATLVQVGTYIDDLEKLRNRTSDISELLKKVKIKIVELNKKGDSPRLLAYKEILKVIINGIKLDKSEENIMGDIYEHIPNNL